MSALALPIVSKFDPKGIIEAKSGLDRLGGFARGAGFLLAGAFAAGAVAAGAFAVSALRAADESWKVGKALDQAAKNAGVFGSTEADIKAATGALKEHAQKLGELTGIDDEVLLSIEKTWMAVPTLAGLGTAGIEHLAEVAANVSAGTGKDVETIGLAFIKIAGDSETAMSKLTRAGVVFSDEQKNTYQAMLDAGDEIGAQSYLIDQLDAKYKGLAEASASPLDRMKQMWQNLQEIIGTAFMPVLEKLAPMVGDFIKKLTASPKFTVFIDQLGIAFSALLDALLPIMPILGDILMNVFQALTPLLGAFSDVLLAILPAIVDLSAELPGWIDSLLPIIPPLVDLVQNLLPPLVDLLGTFITLIVNNPALMTDLIGGLEAAAGVAQELGAAIQYVSDLLKTFDDQYAASSDAISAATGMIAANPMGGSAAAQYQVALHNQAGLTPHFAGKLAAGGVVMPKKGGTLATIGEAGSAEAVIPLDRLDRMMNGGGGGATYNVVVNGGLSTSADIGRAVVDAIKRFERSSGPVFVGA
jgi:hypothetical protein